MKRRKITALFWIIWLNEVMVYFGLCEVESSTIGNLAITKFQHSLQQQSTVTILSSIEERLRNLDNVYSMQLTQNIETKLNQYNKNLENLESKLMRLEAIVMLNLGKISENISTKNFKDDITKTDTLRKLDSIYEGLTHRLNYIERKLESNSMKNREKVEEMLTRLDNMEKGTSKRDSELETELSAVISAIDDLKKTYKDSEQKVGNVTEEIMSISKHTFNMLSKYNSDTRKSMNKLHDNLVGNLQYVDNRTTQHMKISDDTNILLKQMKIELKEDFNNYANKVADMNSDMWKNTDITEDDLKNIALVVNSTKIELQNSVRSLMLQIGKLSQKDSSITTDGDYKGLENKMIENFDKILTNQDMFLESCHRLQMDESQIESEISDMLNKLIDMVEKKLASEKNFDKILKSHDNRINRNLFQANQNIISLFEKSSMNTQMIITEIKKVGTDLNALFTFIQSTTSDGSTPTSKVILEKLGRIEKSTKNINDLIPTYKKENISTNQVYREVQQLSKTLTKAIEQMQNDTRNFHTHQNDSMQVLEYIIKKNLQTSSVPSTVATVITRPEMNDTIRESVARIFGTNSNKISPKPKKKCPQNVRDLIDIRAGVDSDCEEMGKATKKPRRKKLKYDIDIRADFKPDNHYDADVEYEDISATTTTSKSSPDEATTHIMEKITS